MGGGDRLWRRDGTSGSGGADGTSGSGDTGATGGGGASDGGGQAGSGGAISPISPVACEELTGVGSATSISLDGNDIQSGNVNGLTFKGFGVLSANGTSEL